MLCKCRRQIARYSLVFIDGTVADTRSKGVSVNTLFRINEHEAVELYELSVGVAADELSDLLSGFVRFCVEFDIHRTVVCFVPDDERAVRGVLFVLSSQ